MRLTNIVEIYPYLFSITKGSFGVSFLTYALWRENDKFTKCYKVNDTLLVELSTTRELSGVMT